MNNSNKLYENYPCYAIMKELKRTILQAKPVLFSVHRGRLVTEDGFRHCMFQQPVVLLGYRR